MEGKILRNISLILVSVLLLAPGGWAAGDRSVLRVRGLELACPISGADNAERAVLDAIVKGKFDKARRKLASLRLESVSRPQLALLAALTDFAQGTDPVGAGLTALLDPAVPAHVQVRAELEALGGDPCRAAGSYAGVDPKLMEGLRLRHRMAELETACLDAFSARLDALWREGDFTGMEGLVAGLPEALQRDGRAARAAFPAAVLSGDASRARALLERLPDRDRDRNAAMVSALELDPSLRLSYMKRTGGALLTDPLGQALYARALDEWLVGNMPEDFRRAWAAPALTQRDLALLLCLHFPGVKGGASPGADLPASILDDSQADCLASLASQGFLPGYRPEGPVSADDAVRALGRALEAAGLLAPCSPGLEAWVRCGLLPAGLGGGPLSGQQWSTLAHRARGDLP